jgi:hypothetical protein
MFERVKLPRYARQKVVIISRCSAPSDLIYLEKPVIEDVLGAVRLAGGRALNRAAAGGLPSGAAQKKYRFVAARRTRPPARRAAAPAVPADPAPQSPHAMATRQIGGLAAQGGEFSRRYSYPPPGIVCGACMNVHTPIFASAQSSMFMRLRALWHAWKACHCWG